MSTDIQSSDEGGNDNSKPSNVDMGVVAYLCYAVGIVLQVLVIAGLIIAYIQRNDDTSDWRNSHYTWLIRTFWISIVVAVAAALTSFLGLGFIFAIALLVWYIIRLVKGWQFYAKQQPIPDPEHLLFG